MMRYWMNMGSPVRLMTRRWARPFARFNSTRAAPKKKGIKDLVKEYGYSALGVYLGLSFIDLPICYVVVHSQGKDEIEYYENKLKQQFGYGVSDTELEQKQARDRAAQAEEQADAAAANDSGITAFVRKHFSWTEFAIAYGIHKSLIFIRLPITAAITPGIVKVLRNWGFKIGSGTSAAVAKDHLMDAKQVVVDYTASSPKFGVKPGKRRWWWFF
ncbi:hypothetical protein DICA3_F10858 [Diutina catenulata]